MGPGKPLSKTCHSSRIFVVEFSRVLTLIVTGPFGGAVIRVITGAEVSVGGGAGSGVIGMTGGAKDKTAMTGRKAQKSIQSTKKNSPQLSGITKDEGFFISSFWGNAKF